MRLKFPIVAAIAALAMAVQPAAAEETCFTQGSGQFAFAIHTCVSSVLPSQSGNSYGPRNLSDGNPNTAWCEGVRGPGIGETITLHIDEGASFRRLQIANGYGKSQAAFQANGRPRLIEITTDRTPPTQVVLIDQPGMLPVPLLQSAEYKWVRLRILSVYPGMKYDDTCVGFVGPDFEYDEFLLQQSQASEPADTGEGAGQGGVDDATLLAWLGTAPDEDRRADILAQLADRRSDTVRVALEGIAGNDAQPDATRMQAICALSGSVNRDSVPLLLSILEEDLTKRRGFWACAIPVLGNIGDRRAVPLLMRIADLNQDDLAGMDHMAIEALAVFADARDVRYLESKVHIWPVRPAIFAALARVADPASAEVLVTGLYTGEDPEVVAAAQDGLRRIGAAARPALEEALHMPADDQFRQRVEMLLKALR
ncbi:HEAT repeat domain-containing protein [Thalassovita mangrovi]|uniref:NAD glycohydrolase translocation F5/8 type C domain-containing protein n=1 Tax=Thalassovita mangrovi TaxID=2692236 RepID=A0A6L8LJ46_9RHOB|nr:HEAT repeat domain-containing protein [Thalassovita mangrovi]MYM54490.1 hypothetical protein [Thalassovita mangrovi]